MSFDQAETAARKAAQRSALITLLAIASEQMQSMPTSQHTEILGLLFDLQNEIEEAGDE